MSLLQSKVLGDGDEGLYPVLDPVDAALEEAVRDNGLHTLITPSVMETLDDKTRLAKKVFAFAVSLTKSR